MSEQYSIGEERFDWDSTNSIHAILLLRSSGTRIEDLQHTIALHLHALALPHDLYCVQPLTIFTAKDLVHGYGVLLATLVWDMKRLYITRIDASSDAVSHNGN